MNNEYQKLFLNKWVILLLLFALVLRGIWFFTPLENDEGVYLSRAKQVVEQDKAIRIRTSPFIYFGYLIPAVFSNYIFFRIYSAIIFFITLVFMILLIYEIDKNIIQAVVGGVIYLFIANIPLMQGFLLKPSTLFNLNLVISLFFLYRYFNSKLKVYFFVSSMFFTFSLLTNSPNMIYISLINLILILNMKHKFNLLFKYLFFPFISIPLISMFIFVVFKLDIINIVLETFTFFYFDFVNHANFHFFTFPFLFLEAMTIPLIILVISYLNYNKLGNYKTYLLFLTLVFSSFFILPTFGHYVYGTAPLLAIIGSKSLSQEKMKKYVILLFIFFLVFIVYTSWKYYPNLNIENSVNFHEFDSFKQQNHVKNFLLSNLDQNESFYYYGWNEGIYWLTNRIDEYNLMALIFFDNPPFEITRIDDWEIKRRYKYKYLLVPNENDQRYSEKFDIVFGHKNLKYNTTIGNIDVFEIYG